MCHMTAHKGTRERRGERRRGDGYDIKLHYPIRALHFKESLFRGEKCDLLLFCSSKGGFKPMVSENPGVTVYKKYRKLDHFGMRQATTIIVNFLIIINQLKSCLTDPVN